MFVILMFAPALNKELKECDIQPTHTSQCTAECDLMLDIAALCLMFIHVTPCLCICHLLLQNSTPTLPPLLATHTLHWLGCTAPAPTINKTVKLTMTNTLLTSHK